MRRLLRGLDVVVLALAFGLFVWAVRDESAPRWLPLAVLLLALAVSWVPRVAEDFRGGADSQRREDERASRVPPISPPVLLPDYLLAAVSARTRRTDVLCRAVVGLSGAAGAAVVVGILLGPGDPWAAAAAAILTVVVLVLLRGARDRLAAIAARAQAGALSRRIAGHLRFTPSARDIVVLVRDGTVESNRRVLRLDEEGVVVAAVGPPPPPEIPSFWLAGWRH